MQWDGIDSSARLDAALASAEGKPVLLDFYADWCASCKEMERFTFTDSRVAETLAGMVRLRADITSNENQQRGLLKRFGLFGPPGIVFFDARGREVAGARVIGFEKADRFLASVQRARLRPTE